ncbi:MAG: DUF6220 domain-containing protein [Chloroflexota bacterium]
MTNALRSIWATLIVLFVVAIPVQFYLAGHGAMEGAHAADKSIAVMKTAWDPHSAIGTLMLLVSILILLVALSARLPRPVLGITAGLFVSMVVQFVLPLLNDSASTRWIAALHAVNALVVTGLTFMLMVRAWQYLPMRRSTHAGAGTTTMTGE